MSGNDSPSFKLFALHKNVQELLFNEFILELYKSINSTNHNVGIY